MLLGLETFSYHLAFAYGGMDVFSFIERTHGFGLDGVQINAEGFDMGHLGGDDPGFLKEVRSAIDEYQMYVEVDSNIATSEHLSKMLGVCNILGADKLRVYASMGGDIKEELGRAPERLREVLPLCAEYGVKIAFENHEYETSDEVLEVVRKVDSEYVGTHVDTGNSMSVWEDPVQAVKAMAPYAVSTHFKDSQVIVVNGEPFIVGVPLGRGSIDCAECFRILAEESPLERINIEVCYAYMARFSRPRELGCGAELGKGAFSILEPPYDPEVIAPFLLDSAVDGQNLRAFSWQEMAKTLASGSQREEVLRLQDQAVAESVEYVKGLNRKGRRPI